MSISRTVVISCAGMGNRLGLGTTKALVEISGKPLIIRHLEMLSGESDVRVIVGFQAESVIQTVRKYRNDVLFCFNHKYNYTGVGESVSLAAKCANEYLLTIDGNIVIHPDDMKKALSCEHEFISGGEISSDEPWLIQTVKKDNIEVVSKFTRESGQYEWNGISQIESSKFIGGAGHVFQVIEPYLPIEFLNLRTREIDTIDDYERAVTWVQNDFA